MANILDIIAPTPKWYLTDYAVQRLKTIDPVKYNTLITEYDKLVADTKAAYVNVIPNTLGDISSIITKGLLIVGGFLLIALVVGKK